MIDLNEFFSMKMPCQVHVEWFSFIQFCQDYFIKHGVAAPLVVEIGTHANLQRSFYKKYLNASHIGIDIENKYSQPDILGDSRDKDTIAKLNRALAGRPIDLLFIDGNHDYEIVKQDYENYNPLVKHITAFHDILSWPGVTEFWEELMQANPDCDFMQIGAMGEGAATYGIGVVVKG